MDNFSNDTLSQMNEFVSNIINEHEQADDLSSEKSATIDRLQKLKVSAQNKSFYKSK